MSMLKQDYKEGEMTLSAALALAIKVLNKTMDVSKLSAEKGVCVRVTHYVFSFCVGVVEKFTVIHSLFINTPWYPVLRNSVV